MRGIGIKRDAVRELASDTKRRLRSLPIAKQCMHLGKLLDKTKCGSEVFACAVHGTCSQQRKACGKDGVKYCLCCTDWKRKQDNLHQSPPPGSEPFPEKQPVTVKMLFTFGDTTIERTMTGIINDLLAIWSFRDNMSWFNVSLMHNEGPVKHYRFAVEYFAEGRRLFHIYSARLKLLSVAPFYAMAGGIFVPDEKTATADIPAMVGQKWAVSIAEVKHDPS